MRTAAVDIWTIALDDARPAVLSPAEIARAGRFCFRPHRLHWTNAHSALRSILSDYLQCDPLALEFTVNENGKPAVTGVEFNLSHTQDVAMIAVSKDAAVGIDVERLRPNVDMAALLARLGETDLPTDLDGLHQRWTRREAATKARGGKLFDPIDAGIRIVDLAAPAGHFAALAAVDAMPEARYCGSR